MKYIVAILFIIICIDGILVGALVLIDFFENREKDMLKSSILEYMQSLLDEANSTNYLRHDELIEEYNSIRKMLDVIDGDNHEE